MDGLYLDMNRFLVLAATLAFAGLVHAQGQLNLYCSSPNTAWCQGMPAASIEFRDVTKRFGDVVAVDRVSFTVAPGTLVTLLGPSGCGKTTTLRLIAGLELPSAGRILIGERDVTHVPAAERDVSMVFQSYALFPHMAVL